MSDLYADYDRLAHAVQSGVAAKMQLNSSEADPKHLRTGLNLVMSDHAALAKLLIAKGVITEEEYAAALMAGLREEVARYEKSLSEHYRGNVTLG